MIQDRHRHAGAVAGRGVDAAHHIVFRIVTRGDFLTLDQGALTRAHVVVIGLFRGGRAFIGETHLVGGVFIAAIHAQGVGFLIKRDLVLFAGPQVAHDDAGQGV